MRLLSRPSFIAAVSATVTIATVLLIGPVNAQTVVLPTARTLPQMDLRLGAYLPLNSAIKSAVGEALPAGGVDYFLNHEGTNTFNIISVDVMDRSSGQSQLQLIPVTYGMIHYSDPTSVERMYDGFGLGGYFASQTIPTSVGGSYEDNHTMLWGGYLNVGMDFQDFFIDARYHITTSLGSSNPSGIELTLGHRF